MNIVDQRATRDILPEAEQVRMFNDLWNVLLEQSTMKGIGASEFQQWFRFKVADPEHDPKNPTGKFQIAISIFGNFEKKIKRISIESESRRNWATTMRKGNIHFSIPLDPNSSAQKTLEAIAREPNGEPALYYVAEKQSLEAGRIFLETNGDKFDVRTSEQDRQSNFRTYQGDHDERWYHGLLRAARLMPDIRGSKGISTSHDNFFKLNDQSAGELQTRIVLAADHMVRSLLAGGTTLENDALAEAVSEKLQALQTGVRDQVSEVDTSFVAIPSISWQRIDKDEQKLRKMGVPI